MLEAPSNSFSLTLLTLFLVCGCDTIRVNVANSSSSVQGSGVSLTETREIEPFTELEVRGTGVAKITFGSPQSFLVTADDNIVPLIKSEIVDDQLVIEPSESISTRTPLVMEITVEKLDRISASGAVGVEFSNFEGESLTIGLEGASRCEGSGKVTNLKVDASGATSIGLKNLITENTTIHLNGAGTAQVHATKSFDGTASGVARITCTGNPKGIAKSANGIAAISVD